MNMMSKSDYAAHEDAVRGYSRSRVRNAERIAGLAVKFGTFGMLFGMGWMGMWMFSPREHQVHHWMMWDGVHAPFELPSMKIAVTNAPKDLNLYFAQEYAMYRERYYYDMYPSDRLHVAYQTGAEEMQEYNAEFDVKNPDSPLNDPGKNGFIEFQVTGSDIEFNTETKRYHSKVYFTRRFQKYGSPHAPAVPMMADFTWEKHPENVPENMHTYSPIGMVVIHYNRQKQGVTQ